MDTIIGIENRSNDRKYFTIVPNYILNHSNAIDKAIYIDMKRVAGENGLCFMTEETICKRNKIGKEQLHKSLKYLINNKWIEYVGTTPSKTRPIKTYKILDIWKQNTDFYQEKKIPSETTVSQEGKKDTACTSGKIPPGTGGIRRTNTKEELNTNGEPKGSGFKSISSLLRNRSPSPNVAITARGAKYSWQDVAVRWWTKLSLKGKPTASWFKLFRDDRKTIERACSFSQDSNSRDLEKLVYWKIGQIRKEKNDISKR